MMRYYRYLSESNDSKGAKAVTSAQIAEALDIDPTQVRKDFGAIGLLGLGRVGYDACEACRATRVALGFDRPYEAILIGTGRLGSALLAYPGFKRYGCHIVCAFDNNERRIGKTIAGVPIRSIRSLRPFITRHGIRFAILTTPVEVSQRLTDRVVDAGVTAIWNFSPMRLNVPDGILVRNEHISIGLSEIAYHLKEHA
jgi:redox-sensing transcriptional repressor